MQSMFEDTPDDRRVKAPAIDSDLWIHVKEHLPAVDADVWVLMEAGISNPNHPGFGTDKWVRRSCLYGSGRMFIHELVETGSVTHWQPVVDDADQE